MSRIILSVCLALSLVACASKKAIVTTVAPAPKVQTASRSEPIFYNGKTYQLDYSFNAGSNWFDMQVGGLGPKQQKDAENIATSALAYYACPDGQRGKLQGAPGFASGKWNIRAMCG